MGVTQRHLILEYGFNQRHLLSLIKRGVLKTLPLEKMANGKVRKSPLICEKSFKDLIKGEHYILCKECGSYLAQVTTKHLQSCSNIKLADYFQKHPTAIDMCSFTKENKAKTEEQKHKQSKKLKARFQTPQGEITREQIRQASIRMQQGDYGDQAKAHLQSMARDTLINAIRREKSLQNWQNDEYKEKLAEWRETNRDQVLESARKARTHISHTFTKPHQIIKEQLKALSISSETEYPFDYYLIDEAIPHLKIAIEIDGCYWHGCTVCGFETNAKVKGNDKAKNSNLKNKGWVVLRLKEHSIYNDLDDCIRKIQNLIADRENYYEYSN